MITTCWILWIPTSGVVSVDVEVVGIGDSSLGVDARAWELPTRAEHRASGRVKPSSDRRSLTRAGYSS